MVKKPTESATEPEAAEAAPPVRVQGRPAEIDPVPADLDPTLTESEVDARIAAAIESFEARLVAESRISPAAKLPVAK